MSDSNPSYSYFRLSAPVVPQHSSEKEYSRFSWTADVGVATYPGGRFNILEKDEENGCSTPKVTITDRVHDWSSHCDDPRDIKVEFFFKTSIDVDNNGQLEVIDDCRFLYAIFRFKKAGKGESLTYVFDLEGSNQKDKRKKSFLQKEKEKLKEKLLSQNDDEAIKARLHRVKEKHDDWKTRVTSDKDKESVSVTAEYFLEEQCRVPPPSQPYFPPPSSHPYPHPGTHTYHPNTNFPHPPPNYYPEHPPRGGFPPAGAYFQGPPTDTAYYPMPPNNSSGPRRQTRHETRDPKERLRARFEPR